MDRGRNGTGGLLPSREGMVHCGEKRRDGGVGGSVVVVAGSKRNVGMDKRAMLGFGGAGAGKQRRSQTLASQPISRSDVCQDVLGQRVVSLVQIV